MKAMSIFCAAGFFMAACVAHGGDEPLPVPPMPKVKGSNGVLPLPQSSGKETVNVLLPPPNGKEVRSITPSGKEMTSVTPSGKAVTSVTPSGKEAKKAAAIQPVVAEPEWEIALTGGARQFTLDFSTKPTAAFHTSPLDTSETLTRGYGGLELRRILWQGENTIFRFGLGYNYSAARWNAPEHEAGEAPGEIYVLDTSRFSLHSHQITALVDLSWKVGRAWQVGVRAGPTLSIFDGSFSGGHETFAENTSHTNGTFVTGHLVDDNSTKLVVGVMGELFIRYTIPDSSFFIELRGGYEWVDHASWGDSTIRATLDGSSWLASLSLGYEW